MWLDNEDGTYTAEEGDTLWSLQEKTGKSWDSFGYEGDPTKLQIGETVGKLTTTTVEAEGSGNGFFLSAIAGEAGSQLDKSWYTMYFHIKETGEKFSAKFTTTSVEGEGLKIGVGIYTISLEASAVFKGKPPTREQIISDFAAGESDSLGFGLIFVGINGTESGRWTITTGNLNASLGCPLSFGVERARTRVR